MIRRAVTRTLLTAMLAAAGLAGAAPDARAQACPSVSAPSAIVVEASSGRAACAKAADQRRAIASTTKLMTALVVLESTKLSAVAPAAAYRGLSVESKLGLRPGEKMTVADLLRALLIASANDAAETLAAHVGGSRASFVRRMNRRAQQLGLTNTRFANPIGLDEPGNYSTARDLARLTLELRRFRFFRRTVDREGVTLQSGVRPRTISNRNLLVERYGWIDGVKTGHTQQAGWVLIASGRRRGVPLVSVVLGTASEDARNADALELLNFGVGRFRVAEAVERGDVVAGVPVRYRAGARLGLGAARSVSRVLAKGENFDLRVIDVPDEVSGPISRGEKLGRLEVRLDDRVLTTVSLMAVSDVPEAGLARRAQDWMTRPVTLLVLGLLLVAGSVATWTRRSQGPDDGSPRPREVEAT